MGILTEQEAIYYSGLPGKNPLPVSHSQDLKRRLLAVVGEIILRTAWEHLIKVDLTLMFSMCRPVTQFSAAA